MDVLLKRTFVALTVGLFALVSFLGALQTGFSSAHKQKTLNNLRELDAAIYELELSPRGTQRVVYVTLDDGLTVCGSSTAESTFGAEVNQQQNIWIARRDGGISKLSLTGYDMRVSFEAPATGPGLFEFVLTRGVGDTVVVQASKIDT